MFKLTLLFDDWGTVKPRAGVKYVFVFVFVFKYANICICICIWKTTRWNICICIYIWLAYLGVFDKYFSNTLLIFTLKYIMIILINIIFCLFYNPWYLYFIFITFLLWHIMLTSVWWTPLFMLGGLKCYTSIHTYPFVCSQHVVTGQWTLILNCLWSTGPDVPLFIEV